MWVQILKKLFFFQNFTFRLYYYTIKARYFRGGDAKCQNFENKELKC